MTKALKISLIVIAALLLFNGLVNVVDGGRLFSYDITSILAGVGFLLLGILRK